MSLCTDVCVCARACEKRREKKRQEREEERERQKREDARFRTDHSSQEQYRSIRVELETRQVSYLGIRGVGKQKSENGSEQRKADRRGEAETERERKKKRETSQYRR